MDKIRIGVVGLGKRGRTWLKTLQAIDTYEITAICDHIEPLVQEATTLLKEPEKAGCFTDFYEMLEKAPIDAVGVVAEPNAQVKLACESMNAGKHVVCEVPLSYRYQDYWDLVVAVEKSNVKFQMAEQARYRKFIQATRKMAEQGMLGKILYAEGEYLAYYGSCYCFRDSKTGKYLTSEEAKSNPNAVSSDRSSEHPIAYIPHELSPLLSVIKDRVVTVSCMGTKFGSYTDPAVPRRDFEVAIMHTANDTLIRILNGFTTPTPGHPTSHWYQIIGTEGSVEWKRAKWDQAKMWLKNAQMPDWAGVNWDDDVRASNIEHGGRDPFPLIDFAEAIKEDRKPEIDIYTAIEACVPGIVATMSVEKGGRVLSIPDFRPGPNRKKGEYPLDGEPKEV
mgnify:CR=1 FL=1